MKKTLVALILANAFTATTAFAAADVGTWYGGAKFGWSHYFDTNTGAKAHDANNSFDQDNVGGGVYTGYQITPWLAVEGGYDYLGNMQIKGQHGALRLVRRHGARHHIHALHKIAQGLAGLNGQPQVSHVGRVKTAAKNGPARRGGRRFRHLYAHLPLAKHHKLGGGQFVHAHGAVGMQL